jgi:8-oxo-dGTP diphosphatase
MTTVAAGIFVEGKKVLIARRAEGQTLSGFWEFPGGKQEAGESILRSLEREIREEFGVACSARRVICETTYEYAQGAIRLVGVEAELVERDITISVHDEYRWIEIADLGAYRLAPADLALAEAVRKEYLKASSPELLQQEAP